MLYDEQAGSDVFSNIRTHIMVISINIIKPYAGGVSYPHIIGHMELYDAITRYPNSCFYVCIREIWKSSELRARLEDCNKYKIKKFTYEKMRTMLTGSPDDVKVSLDKLAEAERIFGMSFIVFWRRTSESRIFEKRAKIPFLRISQDTIFDLL